MFAQVDPVIRQADVNDRSRLANLVHFEFYVHRHLDWREPLDWLDQQPFLLLERRDKPLGALACPPDPPGIAWVHLFVTASGSSPEQVWSQLWPATLERLRNSHTIVTVAALPTQNWFRVLLEEHQFLLTQEVIHLAWHRGTNTGMVPSVSKYALRPMNSGDIPAVANLDVAAFSPLWQNSPLSLQCAFQEAAIATVVEEDGALLGYQISTATSAGGHLARLAVHPNYQGQRIASHLLTDLMERFGRRGAEVITVNTQSDNLASLALYARMGFKLTGDRNPVYEFKVMG